MISKLSSCYVSGIEGEVVDVEVDISNGLPGYFIVGLPETCVKESKDRVRAAIKNSGYSFPMKKLVVNLAPADLKKEGTGFDLPIALGILTASKVITPDKIKGSIVIGELSLDGRVKPVKNVLPCALAAEENGFKSIIVPHENSNEAAMVKGIEVFPVKHLSNIVDFCSGFGAIQPLILEGDPHQSLGLMSHENDFSEVKGQFHAKRALEIAAAGSHNILMQGPPGSGKSMLAKRLPTILPDLVFEEAVDVTRIYSVMGMVQAGQSCLMARPFRSPHHTISDAGLAGGGSKPMPGEISLAHKGVLFLDELPEFKRSALEVLRQPLEDGEVSIARAGAKATYPSDFMLVAAMNPCPCGYLSDTDGKCSCTHSQVQKYRARVSGPLLDRMDIQIEVPRVGFEELTQKKDGEPSSRIRKRVVKARKIQQKRLKDSGLANNAAMHSRHLRDFCSLDTGCEIILKKAVDVLELSARACHSVLRISRTIADLEGADEISREHLSEAIQYRSFDRG